MKIRVFALAVVIAGWCWMAFVFWQEAYPPLKQHEDFIARVIGKKAHYDGRTLGGRAVRVCRLKRTRTYPCFPLAALYSDRDMKVPLANPVYTDPLGHFSFYAEPGDYYFEVSK